MDGSLRPDGRDGRGAATVDGARLLDRLAQLRRIGGGSDGSVTRPAYGPEDVAARDLVAGWMAEAGLGVVVDGAANLVGRRPGRRPDRASRWLVTGSHLDTVPDGGWLDGAYGVVAAVEVAATLAAGHVDLEHGLVTVAFANEEGARGTAGMVGSRAIVGEVTEAELGTPDDEGVPLHERLRAAHATGPLATARWDLATVEAFVELHIEQGPVLDAAERDLGVVTAVTGRRSLDVDVRGRANHAGTTPMDRRHDALAAAAELVLTVEALAREGVVRVATCGRIEAHPGAGNVVPGHVRLAAELRDEDPDRLDAATDVVTSWLTGIARRRGVDITVTPGQRVAPTPADDRVRRTIRRVVAATGRPWTELPSGAGHDAQVLGAHVPMGMIFVPSRGGISHAPDEDTAAEHLVAGAQALCDTLLALDAETGGRTWVDSGGRGTRNHPISAAAPAGATATTGATGERS